MGQGEQLFGLISGRENHGRKQHGNWHKKNARHLEGMRARSCMCVCVCIYVCIYLCIYTPNPEGPVPDPEQLFGLYIRANTAGNNNTAVGSGPGESLTPEPEPEQFIGLSSPEAPNPDDPGCNNPDSKDVDFSPVQ